MNNQDEIQLKTVDTKIIQYHKIIPSDLDSFELDIWLGGQWTSSLFQLYGIRPNIHL